MGGQHSRPGRVLQSICRYGFWVYLFFSYFEGYLSPRRVTSFFRHIRNWSWLCDLLALVEKLVFFLNDIRDESLNQSCVCLALHALSIRHPLLKTRTLSDSSKKAKGKAMRCAGIVHVFWSLCTETESMWSVVLSLWIANLLPCYYLFPCSNVKSFCISQSLSSQ